MATKTESSQMCALCPCKPTGRTATVDQPERSLRLPSPPPSTRALPIASMPSFFTPYTSLPPQKGVSKVWPWPHDVPITHLKYALCAFPLNWPHHWFARWSPFSAVGSSRGAFGWLLSHAFSVGSVEQGGSFHKEVLWLRSHGHCDSNLPLRVAPLKGWLLS